MSQFQKYLLRLENKTPSEVKLSDTGEFKPFIVDDEHHKNLKPIVKAFVESGKVPFPGVAGFPDKFSTVDGDKGEITPKIKKKNLYLTGGAVRDHLKSKTPRDYDLVTDATPEEIRLILKHNDFKEIKPEKALKRHEHLPEKGGNKSFYAQKWDRSGKEFVFIVKVNNQEFELSTLRKDHKGEFGALPEKISFSSLEEDAEKRDLTINSLYIPLTNYDGPNAKIIDPHGGVHHLKDNDVKFVGNPKDRLKENPLRALRYIRFAAVHGKDTIPEDIQEAIDEIKDLSQVEQEKIKDEFMKGLEDPDVDTKKYIKLYKAAGLLPAVFRGAEFKLNSPEDFNDTKDKKLAVAWILRGNPKYVLNNSLSHWKPRERDDIQYLVDLAHWFGSHEKHPEEFYGKFYDIRHKLDNGIGLVPSMIRKWAQMNKVPDHVADHFLRHEFDTKTYVDNGFGSKIFNPEMAKLGLPPHDAIRHIETEKFRKRF